jgi:hypothetical protein
VTPTPALRDDLRELLDEQIPAGGADSDTLFPDAELDAVLRAVDYLELAAAELWSRKAGRVMRDDLSEIAVGAERYRAVDPVKRAEHARTMAEMYAQRAPAGGSSLVSVEPPDVLGSRAAAADVDVSRLLWGVGVGPWWPL